MCMVMACLASFTASANIFLLSSFMSNLLQLAQSGIILMMVNENITVLFKLYFCLIVQSQTLLWLFSYALRLCIYSIHICI